MLFSYRCLSFATAAAALKQVKIRGQCAIACSLVRTKGTVSIWEMRLNKIIYFVLPRMIHLRIMYTRIYLLAAVMCPLYVVERFQCQVEGTTAVKELSGLVQFFFEAWVTQRFYIQYSAAVATMWNFKRIPRVLILLQNINKIMFWEAPMQNAKRQMVYV